MKDTCKQTSQHRTAPRVELICTGGDQPKSRIRIFQHPPPPPPPLIFSCYIYPIFKNKKHNDSFHRAFQANARAQDLSTIIDPGFKPKYHDSFACELFDDQQSFMYSVLVTTLQTKRGRELTKEFEGDAQRILREMHIYLTQSEMAQNIILEITNLHLTDTWKGTTQQFLAHFKEKLRLSGQFICRT